MMTKSGQRWHNVARPMKAVTSWRESLEEVRELLGEAGVFYHEVPL